MKSPRRATPAPALPDVTMSEHDGVRHLHLDSPWIQGSMRLKAPYDIELEYVQRMMAWGLWVDVDAVASLHAMQLGLGAAAITKFCRKRLGMRTTAVELNPQVIGACRRWFRLPDDDARLTVLQADAGEVAADPARAGTVDVLCVDLYDHEAAAPVLDDDAFYAGCHALLAPEGVMSVNLFGRHASFARSAARVAALFGSAHCISLRPTREGNTVLLARKGHASVPRETLLARAATIERDWRLPARKWLRMLRPLA